MKPTWKEIDNIKFNNMKNVLIPLCIVVFILIALIIKKVFL